MQGDPGLASTERIKHGHAARLGAYRTGIITVAAFALTALYSLKGGGAGLRASFSSSNSRAPFRHELLSIRQRLFLTPRPANHSDYRVRDFRHLAL
jgi:hypothetical protein